MKQVKYIGGSHIRHLSVADLAGIGIEQEEEFRLDARISDTFEMANDKAEKLLKGVPGEFEIIGDVEESTDDAQQALDFDSTTTEGTTDDEPEEPATTTTTTRRKRT